jgi:hypothetical protein
MFGISLNSDLWLQSLHDRVPGILVIDSIVGMISFPLALSVKHARETVLDCGTGSSHLKM